MKERPIIFSSQMVRAILDDKKTQTRRIIKEIDPDEFVADNERENLALCCPYGCTGDRLWVRETFLAWTNTADGSFSHVAAFRADGYELEPGEKWVPPIHMPRKASRITLEISDVRVQQLQEIGPNDARKEGVPPYDPLHPLPAALYYVAAFRDLWNAINGPRGYPWETNSYVYAISFRRIDESPAADST